MRRSSTYIKYSYNCFGQYPFCINDVDVFIGVSKSMEFDAFPKNRTIMTKMKKNRDIKIHNLSDMVDVVEVNFWRRILNIEIWEFRDIKGFVDFVDFKY